MDGDGQWTGLTDLEAARSGVLDRRTSPVVSSSTSASSSSAWSWPRRPTRSSAASGRRCRLPGLGHVEAHRTANSIYYEPEPLACYRLHEGAESSRLMRTGETSLDERRSIDFSCAQPAGQAGGARGGPRPRRRACGRRVGRGFCGRKACAAPPGASLARPPACSLAPAVLGAQRFFVLFIRASIDR